MHTNMTGGPSDRPVLHKTRAEGGVVQTPWPDRYLNAPVQDIAVGDKIRAESTDPSYSVEGIVAEVGGCFIVLDGIGDELDEALHTFSRLTPAAVSERVGRLGAEAVEDLTVMIGREQADSLYMPMGMAAALRDEVARLTTAVDRLRDENVRLRTTSVSFGIHKARGDIIAEQAVTIENLTTTRAEDLHYQRDLEATIERVRCLCAVMVRQHHSDLVQVSDVMAALGSQRTEGQG